MCCTGESLSGYCYVATGYSAGGGGGVFSQWEELDDLHRAPSVTFGFNRNVLEGLVVSILRLEFDRLCFIFRIGVLFFIFSETRELAQPATDSTDGILKFLPISQLLHMFIALLLRVIPLLLPPLTPSSGAYYTVSDDRVPQMVPDRSNSSP